MRILPALPLLFTMLLPGAFAEELTPLETSHFSELLGRVSAPAPSGAKLAAQVCQTKEASKPAGKLLCNGSEATEAELREKSRVLWLNTRLELEKTNEESFRKSIRLQSEELERFSKAAKKANQEIAAELLSSDADRLRLLADEPRLKERILETTDQLLKGSEQKWAYRKPGLLEFSGIAALAAGSVYFETRKPGTDARWTDKNGFDETIRSTLRVSDRATRDYLNLLGDVLMGGLISAPVIDTFVTLGVRDSNWEAAWQTNVINLESFAFTALASSLLQNVVARERPFVRNCKDGNCEYGLENRSMPSGHAAFAFTGAGLICTHHSYLSLYKNPNADQTACITALGLATVAGLSRVMADRHYASDVAVGSVIGLFSGFALPRLLHYSWHYSSKTESRKESPKTPPGIREIAVGALPLRVGGGISCEIRF